MRILGIDPGIAIVGFGVVDSDRGKHSTLRSHNNAGRDKPVQPAGPHIRGHGRGHKDL